MRTPRFAALVAAAAMIGSGPQQAQAQIDLQLVGNIDVVGTIGVSPLSISAYGTDLYVGTGGSTGSLYKITDALTNPMSDGAFGTLPGEEEMGDTTNGYVSLDTNGTTLVAATNNGGETLPEDPATFNRADRVKVFSVAGASPSLNWESDSAALGILDSANRDRIDGAAVDPNTGNVWITAFGNALPTILGSASPTDESDSPGSLFAQSPSGTGWRDLTFDDATGDIYLRGTNGVVAGARNGIDDFTTLNSLGASAGVSQIAGDNSFGQPQILQDSFQSAINIEYLPASLTGGEPAFITNTRVTESEVLADQVLTFDANAGFNGTNPNSLDTRGVSVPLNLLDTDGVTPFTTAGSESAVYDFSYNPVNEYLYISDLTNGSVYVFAVPGTPTLVDGDFNADGRVDNGDLNLLLGAWGSATVPGTWVNGFEAPVDNGELNALLGDWGFGVGTAIPEPATLGLLALATLVVARRR